MAAGRYVGLGLAAAVLCGASLPLQGPLPLARPDAKQTDDAQQQQTPRRQDEKNGEEKTAQPVPKTERQPEANDTIATTPEAELTIVPEDPKAYEACVAELGKMRTAFKPAPRMEAEHGCGIDRPITVSEILPGIKLQPEGTMRCETALALARWTRDSVLPAASVAAADAGAVTAINQASTYICRLRNNAETGKISEHARGNAVDIASFSFEKGKPIEIKPRREDATLSGAFQRTVTASACLYFSTVLDPESDAAHETHLHLDVLHRKNDYRYCR